MRWFAPWRNKATTIEYHSGTGPTVGHRLWEARNPWRFPQLFALGALTIRRGGRVPENLFCPSALGALRPEGKSSYGLGHICANIHYLCRVLRKKPMFFARLMRNYLLLLMKPQRPPLRFADIAVTYDCNMRCTHCSSTSLKRPHQSPLTLDDYVLIAQKLLKAGVLVVNFTGGEPFVRQDLPEIISVFQPHKLLVAIQTNGLLVTEERLSALRELGVDSLGISIDSPDRAVHDTFRNTKGAFDHAVAALGVGAKLGYNVGVSYCLTHSNLHSTEREGIVALAERFGALLNYNLLVPIGFMKGRTDDLLTVEDREYLNHLLRENPRTKTDFETNYYRRGCGAIKEKIYISAYGEVMPCPFIQISFGNILHEDIDTIRRRAFQYSYFSGYPQQCLAAENREFIRTALCYDPAIPDASLPLPYSLAFRSQVKASSTSGAC